MGGIGLKNKSKYGFTIIELIVTIAIVSLLIIPIFTIFSVSFNTFSLSSKKSAAQSLANMALDYIDNEISYAYSASIFGSFTYIEEKKYIYVLDGVIYNNINDVNTEVIRKDLLDKENMISAISFSSTGGKIVTVNIFIRDKTTNEAIIDIEKDMFVKNTPIGVTVGFSPGTVIEYT